MGPLTHRLLLAIAYPDVAHALWVSATFDMPSSIGSSGSPLFSVVDHTVVAMHWGGFRVYGGLDGSSFAIPISTIKDDLRRWLATSNVPAALAARVRAVLDSPKPRAGTFAR